MRVTVEPKKLGESDKQALRGYDNILASIGELETFSDQEIDKYAGFLNRGYRDIKQFIGSVPGMEGLSDARYAQFRALSGRLQGTAFGEGGKQLTPFEASVVFAYTPTGKEMGGPTEFRAKTGQLKSYTTIRRQLTARYTERGIDPTTIPNEVWDQEIQKAMAQAGLKAPSDPAQVPGAVIRYERDPATGRLRPMP